MVESGKLQGGRKKEGTLLPLRHFSPSQGFVYGAREAGTNAGTEARIEVGRSAFARWGGAQQLGVQGSVAKGTHRTRPSGATLDFMQEKGPLGCTKFGTCLCSPSTLSGAGAALP